MAHQVFVSYATEDRDTAARVCAALEAEDIRCWIAPRDVKAGTDYAAAILEAIRNSELVLLIFSEHANTSPYVLREIERAIAYDRPVLSLRLDDAVPNTSMEYYLNLWQMLDASGEVQKNRSEIVSAVRKQLDRARPATSPGERAEAGPRGSTRKRRRGPRILGIAIIAVLLIAAIAGAGAWAASNRTGAKTTSSSLTSAAVINTTSSSAPLTTASAPAPLPGALDSHNTWTELSPSGELPVVRNAQSMVYASSSGRIILFGGYYGENDSLNDTWAYDPAANTWANLNPSGTLPAARLGQSMVYDPIAHRVIMFGGSTADGATNDTWAYDPAANTWTRLSPTGTVPSERFFASMVYDSSNRRIIVFGGTPDATWQPLGDTWAYDPAANSWSELKPAGTLPSARVYPSMAFDPLSGRVIMFGGTGDAGDLNDTWAYDPTTNSWSKLSPTGTLPYPRYGCSMVYSSSIHEMVMFGGAYDKGNGTLNDTWIYDPKGDAWTMPSRSAMFPAARGFQSMVDDSRDGQVIMFGGAMGTGPLNDTWDYTP